MTVWKNGSFYEDAWHYLEADWSCLTTDKVLSGDVVMRLSDWNACDWSSHDGRLGLEIHADDDLDIISKDLEKFDLIVVTFPAFSDGRAFSIARLLRDRFGFQGEIRAKGAYILDQMPLAERCGITTFEISSEAVRTGLSRGAWPDMPRYYQHALDGEGDKARTRSLDPKRPWLSVNIALDETQERTAA